MKILLSNLIGNALRFTRNQLERRIELDVEAGCKPVTYCLRDNGAGFDAAVADELFQPFRRPHGQSDAAGIGLAVAARVVSRQGGRIWASSRPGRGAAFYFRLEPVGSAS